MRWFSTDVLRVGRGGSVGVAACVAAGGLLAAACAGAPPSPTVRLTGAQIALVTSSGGTAAANAEVNNAFELLVQRCMRAKGLVHTP